MEKSKEQLQKEKVIKENLDAGVFICGDVVNRWKCPLCDRKYDFEDEMKECIDSHNKNIEENFETDEEKAERFDNGLISEEEFLEEFER